MSTWLSDTLGLSEGIAKGIEVTIALSILLVLIILFLTLLKKLTQGDLYKGRTRQSRISVIDTAVVDTRRRLLLVRRDNVEHLLLIGGATELVIEQGISRIEANASNRIKTESKTFGSRELGSVLTGTGSSLETPNDLQQEKTVTASEQLAESSSQPVTSSPEAITSPHHDHFENHALSNDARQNVDSAAHTQESEHRVATFARSLAQAASRKGSGKTDGAKTTPSPLSQPLSGPASKADSAFIQPALASLAGVSGLSSSHQSASPSEKEEQIAHKQEASQSESRLIDEQLFEKATANPLTARPAQAPAHSNTAAETKAHTAATRPYQAPSITPARKNSEKSDTIELEMARLIEEISGQKKS